MLPEEMWEEVLSHLEVFNLLRMKRVSKHWNRMITRVIERECKWYEKCVTEIPEDMWSSLLNHQTNPNIRCENFHEAKIHSEIWMTMYRSWIGWNSLTRKTALINDFEVFSENDFLTNIFCAVTGSIVVVGNGKGHMWFYDISIATNYPMYKIHLGMPIGDLVLCRSGSDVIAVSYSVYDIRYWDVKKKKLIRQTNFHPSGRMLNANFDYCYSLSCYENTWVLNVEQFVSGTIRTVRSASITDEKYVFKAMGVDADKAILYMTYDGSGNKFFVNLPDNSFEMLSFDENPHGEARNMFISHKSYFKIFKPCVATYIRFEYDSTLAFLGKGKYFALSVNAKPWKTYDVVRDIGTNCYVSAILYHVRLLMIAIEYDYVRGAEVRLYAIENINDLDKLDLKSMNFRNLRFTSPSINNLVVTEYNSRQYLLVVAHRKIHVVKFE